LLVDIVLALRYLAVAVFLGVSGLIVLHQPRNWSGWLAAAAFLFMPFTFNLAGYTNAWPYPSPWGDILRLLFGMAQVLGIAGLGLLIYVFPDGVFRPRWSAWLAGGLLTLILGFFLASQFVSDGDSLAWFAWIIALFVILISGLVLQYLRYRRTPADERRQNLGFIISLSLFLGWLLLGVLDLGSKYPTVSLAALFLDLVVMCSLPLAIAYAILKHDLWGQATAGVSTGKKRSYLIAWAALWIGGLVILFLARDRLPGGIVEPLDKLAWDKPPIPLIVDTDLSMDDHLALLFLLRHPGVDIQAITVSGTGEVHCEPGVRHMLDILEMLGEPEIPVACGRETPLSGEHAFPDAWREGADTLYGVELPAGSHPPYPGSAVELIQAMLVEEDQPVTLLTLGPLTNPGELLEAHPELAAEIERIWIMGGAVGVPGNVGPSTPEIDNQVAEWNIYVDPLSANLVLRSGAPVTLVPLDATNFVPVSAAFFNRLEANRATPAAQLAYDLMAARREVVLSGTASFWDILTAAVLLDGSLASYKIGGVVVDEAEGPMSGQTRLDENGPRASYAVWADRARFEDHFLQALQR
jgi:pyrimidine-specific ribonucleoside hydrolase